MQRSENLDPFEFTAEGPGHRQPATLSLRQIKKEATALTATHNVTDSTPKATQPTPRRRLPIKKQKGPPPPPTESSRRITRSVARAESQKSALSIPSDSPSIAPTSPRITRTFSRPKSSSTSGSRETEPKKRASQSSRGKVDEALALHLRVRELFRQLCNNAKGEGHEDCPELDEVLENMSWPQRDFKRRRVDDDEDEHQYTFLVSEFFESVGDIGRPGGATEADDQMIDSSEVAEMVLHGETVVGGGECLEEETVHAVKKQSPSAEVDLVADPQTPPTEHINIEPTSAEQDTTNTDMQIDEADALIATQLSDRDPPTWPHATQSQTQQPILPDTQILPLSKPRSTILPPPDLLPPQSESLPAPLPISPPTAVPHTSTSSKDSIKSFGPASVSIVHSSSSSSSHQTNPSIQPPKPKEPTPNPFFHPTFRNPVFLDSTDHCLHRDNPILLVACSQTDSLIAIETIRCVEVLEVERKGRGDAWTYTSVRKFSKIRNTRTGGMKFDMDTGRRHLVIVGDCFKRKEGVGVT
ncbi:hypothetical protein HK097_008769, partial [Rhizophlyctis rosea]